MKNILLTLVFIIISNAILGQCNGIVIDSISKEKIPFTNIWIENENIGTTSNENGEFSIPCSDKNKMVIFSAIGYETKKIKARFLTNTLLLKPKVTELQEITVTPKKQNKELNIGQFKKSDVHFYFACGIKPWIVARYFEFKEDYIQTTYIKKIKILTKSEIKNSKFNIRLYSVDENEKPGEYIYDKNILGVALKGKNITEIDISELNIEFPKKGFFVAIEWLIIESNKYEYTYILEGSKEKLQGVRYLPSIGTIPAETNSNSWVYRKGHWEKVWKNNGIIKKYKDKYNLLAIELILTN